MKNIFNKTKENIWNSCLDFLKTFISEEDFRNWIEPIKPVLLDEKNKTLYIEVPSELFYEHIELHFAEYIFNFLDDTLGTGADIKYQIKSYSHKKEKVSNDSKVKKINSNLNENYTFNNYIIGDFNRVAGSAGLKISESPGKTAFNPLIIYGATGMGKTHIANAIGNRTEQMNPNKNVLYVSSETFITQYSLSVAEKRRGEFINFYQNIDVLIIDDIQFFSGKEGTQSVFFSIFNHLHLSGKQIIMTSDRLPDEIKDVEDRLISRFKWGLCAEISSPDIEDRTDILKSKLSNDSIHISDEIFNFIVSELNTNIRSIEGSVTSLLAHSSFLKTEITLDLAKKVLKQYIKDHSSKKISIDLIKKIVCDYYTITFDKLNSPTRERKIVLARQICMFLSKKYTQLSLEAIGRNIGKKDYSTVVYACKTIENLIQTDKIFNRELTSIESKLFN